MSAEMIFLFVGVIGLSMSSGSRQREIEALRAEHDELRKRLEKLERK